MASRVATMTTDVTIYLNQALGGLQNFNVIDLFKVGEGGWIDPGTGAVPRTPDPDLRNPVSLVQDIDSVVDPSRVAAQQRYAADQRANFSKSLVLSDFTVEAPGILRVRCFLDFGEFNDDGFGSSPEIWEVGLFSDHPQAGISLPGGTKLMVGYATIPKFTKNAGVQFDRDIRLIFRLPTS